MAEETKSKTGEIGSGGIISAGLPAEVCAERIPEIVAQSTGREIPSVLNSKEDLEKLPAEVREVIERFIPTEEELRIEREKWEREVEREKLSREFNPETPGSPAESKVIRFKRILKKAKIWLKFILKSGVFGVKYKKTINHDEWMAVRAEPGYFIYNYEYGFIRNPKVKIKSPHNTTDYIMDPNGNGHILVRRGLPIGVGSAFKVIVEIR